MAPFSKVAKRSGNDKKNNNNGNLINLGVKFMRGPMVN